MCLGIIPGLGIPKTGSLTTYSKRGRHLVLEAAFAKNCYINKAKLMQVAQQTGLTEKTILHWFTKRRNKLRREIKEGTLSSGEYILINANTYIQAYIHVHTCIHTCTYMYYIHKYIHVHTYMHIHTYVHAYLHTHIYTHTCTYIHVHTYLHTYIHTYIDTCM